MNDRSSPHDFADHAQLRIEGETALLPPFPSLSHIDLSADHQTRASDMDVEAFQILGHRHFDRSQASATSARDRLVQRIVRSPGATLHKFQ